MQFAIDEGNHNRFHWRLLGDDGAELAASVPSFASAKTARRAAADVHLHAASATGTER